MLRPGPQAAGAGSDLGRWRIYKNVENSGDRNREQCFYYNSRWQLLEVRKVTRDGETLVSEKPLQQFVWGTRHIDDPSAWTWTQMACPFCRADEQASPFQG